MNGGGVQAQAELAIRDGLGQDGGARPSQRDEPGRRRPSQSHDQRQGDDAGRALGVVTHDVHRKARDKAYADAPEAVE